MKKLIQKIKQFLQLINQKKIKRLQNKTLIFSTDQQYLVHLYVGKLKAHDIESTVLNQRDSMYNTFGSFELYVMPNDAVKAKYIIEKDNE